MRWTLIGLLVCLACHDTTAPDSLSGHYALVSVNGQPVPVVQVFAPNAKESIDAGSLTLNGDGSYAMRTDVTFTGPGFPTQGPSSSTMTGSFVQAGNSLTLLPADHSAPMTASVSGNVILLSHPVLGSLRYVKQ